jgi:hypothetical protein
MILNKYLTKRDLRARGWREKDIKGLIPTGKARNPECLFGAFMNIYDLHEIEYLERSPDFRKARSWDDKVEASKKWARGVKLKVTSNLSLTELEEKLEGKDPVEILAFIRHCYTNYDKWMDLASSRMGGALEARRIIRTRILRSIILIYPSLREGANRTWSGWYPGEDFSK